MQRLLLFKILYLNGKRGIHAAVGRAARSRSKVAKGGCRHHRYDRQTRAECRPLTLLLTPEV